MKTNTKHPLDQVPCMFQSGIWPAYRFLPLPLPAYLPTHGLLRGASAVSLPATISGACRKCPFATAGAQT